MRVHVLKCWPESFAALLDGSKTYEVRKDDRGYAVDDRLHLREYEPSDGTSNTDDTPRAVADSIGRGYWTGRELWLRVTYKTPGGSWGLPEGVCVLGVVPCPPQEAR